MFQKTTLLGLVALAVLVPNALGQAVIQVRDPQTGRRYVADVSAHPQLLQEVKSINAEMGRLYTRGLQAERNKQTLHRFERTLDAQKAQLASIQRTLNSIPKTIVQTGGSAPLGDLRFKTTTNPEWARLNAAYDQLAASTSRAETLVAAYRKQVKLEINRIRDDYSTVQQRIDRWTAQVLALPGVKGQ